MGAIYAFFGGRAVRVVWRGCRPVPAGPGRSSWLGWVGWPGVFRVAGWAAAPGPRRLDGLRLAAARSLSGSARCAWAVGPVSCTACAWVAGLALVACNLRRQWRSNATRRRDGRSCAKRCENIPAATVGRAARNSEKLPLRPATAATAARTAGAAARRKPLTTARPCGGENGEQQKQQREHQ